MEEWIYMLDQPLPGEKPQRASETEAAAEMDLFFDLQSQVN